MARVKRGTKRRARRKKYLRRAKGFFLTKSKLYQSAQEAVNRAERYSYRDRRNRKRQFRRLWIQRIGAAARLNGLSYSQLMHGLKAGRRGHRSQDPGRPRRARRRRLRADRRQGQARGGNQGHSVGIPMRARFGRSGRRRNAVDALLWCKLARAIRMPEADITRQTRAALGVST